MASSSLYQLLLEAMRNPQPGMTPDDPEEIARRYPRSGPPDNPQDEMQTRLALSASLARDPNFRQLSRAPSPIVTRISDGTNARVDLPDWAWSAASQDARPSGTYGANSSVPWGAPPLPPQLPVWPGKRFLPVPRGGLGGPPPALWPSGSSNFHMPEIPELPNALKLLYWPFLMSQSELIRKRLLGERDESKDADTAVVPIEELEARRKKPGSKAGDRPATIRNPPPLAPDAPGETPDTTEETDYCEEQYDTEIERCRTKYPDEFSECQDRAKVRRDLCYRNHRRMKTGLSPLVGPEKWGND